MAVWLLSRLGREEALGPFAAALGIPKASRRDPSLQVRNWLIFYLLSLEFTNLEGLERVIHVLEQVTRKDPSSLIREHARDQLEEARSLFGFTRELWFSHDLPERKQAFEALSRIFEIEGLDAKGAVWWPSHLWIFKGALERESDPDQALRLLKLLFYQIDEMESERPNNPSLRRQKSSLVPLLNRVGERFPDHPQLNTSLANALARLRATPKESAGLEEVTRREFIKMGIAGIAASLEKQALVKDLAIDSTAALPPSQLEIAGHGHLLVPLQERGFKDLSVKWRTVSTNAAQAREDLEDFTIQDQIQRIAILDNLFLSEAQAAAILPDEHAPAFLMDFQTAQLLTPSVLATVFKLGLPTDGLFILELHQDDLGQTRLTICA